MSRAKRADASQGPDRRNRAPSPSSRVIGKQKPEPRTYFGYLFKNLQLNENQLDEFNPDIACH
jgi:hypothetical protein